MSVTRGDVVQLKSGGPAMTVADYDHQGVHCVWFSGSAKMEGRFPSDSLEKIGGNGSVAEKTMVNLFEIVQLAEWYRNQDDHHEYVERAVQAVNTLGSYFPAPKAAELLTKIARGGSSYPHRCRVIAARYLGAA